MKFMAAPKINARDQVKLLGVLEKQGALTADQIKKIKMAMSTTGRLAIELLEEQKWLSHEQLIKAWGGLYGVEYVELREAGASPEALNVLSENVAERYKVFPFRLSPKTNLLEVAMANPLDLAAVNFLETKTGKKIKAYVAPEAEVLKAIRERYAQSLSTEVKEALKETDKPQTVRTLDAQKIGKVIREAPIAKIVTTILEFAMRSRASDVHIEPLEDKTRVRYRIDGILHEKLLLPKSVQDAVVSRIKIVSNMKIDEKRLPQDGRFNFKSGGNEVDLRISSLPTVHGEKIVMRLLKKTAKVPTLPELGLRGRALRNLGTAVLVPHGIILITGPTGSGKTTTLYALLNRINTPRVNIMTLEDPVEYMMEGINQVQTNPKAGLDFASGLRSFLRQDPNIIMVGEIRDKETAELAVQASLTGHLVFSTLHTNSAAGALPRLLDMEAEPFLLASSMTCVVAQRVARRICPSCIKLVKQEAKVVEDFKKVLGNIFDAWGSQKKKLGGTKFDGKELHLMQGAGCDKCNGTGYLGRIGIYEVLRITEQVSRLILERSPASKIQKVAIEQGMLLMKQDGYLKVLDGITSIEEVLRVAQI